MGNPGVGNKFASVNLNKSYGYPTNSASIAGSSRVRPGSNGSGGAGGMVVLSRSRSSIVGVQKGGPRLSVPPPLNLPSLRKEHERFDSSSFGVSSGSGNSGSGSRPTSSGMGWTKPVPPGVQEKDDSGSHSLVGRSAGGYQAVDGGGVDLSSRSVDGGVKANRVYMPPSARSGIVSSSQAGAIQPIQPAEKAVVLRGEDFPSLQATLPVISGPPQKHKDGLHQKPKQKEGEEAFDEQTDSFPSGSLLPMGQSSRITVGNATNENNGVSYESVGASTTQQSRKFDEYFPGPLPLVRLNHTSNWADDERDTGQSLPDQDRFSRTETFREKEFDIPRGGMLPRVLVHDTPDRRDLHDNEARRVSSRETFRVDPYGRDVRTPSREGRDSSSWRVSPLQKDGLGAREVGVDRNAVDARPFNLNREASKVNRYNWLPSGDNFRDDFNSGGRGTHDSRPVRRDSGYGQGGRQNGNQQIDSYSGRRVEQNMQDQHGGDLSNRYKGDFFQKSSTSKSSFSLGSKGLPVNDPILNFGREKRTFSNSRKPYVEDRFLKDFGSTGFDAMDPFSEGLVGVFKRKKDVTKLADFHDPVRESFEAELERVQKIQEQERQRIIEEQERALELARKEEEERLRLAREEEERQRRLVEEARETAWRAEQERLEAVRMAEEKKKAREEEKRLMLLEEERRKEAARKKLLELEAMIARRQAEARKDDNFHGDLVNERMTGVVTGNDVHRVADVGDWEDGERMVERITSSASSDSSNLSRSFEMGSKPFSSRDGNSVFLDRGRAANSWRKELFENGNGSTFLLQDQQNAYHPSRREAFNTGGAFSRKDLYGGPGIMSTKTSAKGLSEPPMMDDFPHLSGHRWNFPGGVDPYNRSFEVDPEFHENFAAKYGDMGWEGRAHGSPRVPHTERLYQNSEVDGLSPFGRSRHSMRQPRVLPPPPPPSSMQKGFFRGQTERPGSSTSTDSDIRYHRAPRKDEQIMQTRYNSSYQEKIEHPGMANAQAENSIVEEQKVEKTATPRCDSQSSLSVSSPPSSPTHLSHDELDDTGDSPLPAAAEGKQTSLSVDESVMLATESGNANVLATSASVSSGEDEEWAIQNNEELAEQEEYDEEEDGYQEEDEVREGYEENNELVKELKDLHIKDKDTPDKMGQLVLGFNEGVEIGIASSDELERTSSISEKAIGLQQDSIGVVEKSGSSDGLIGSGQSFQHENNSLEVSTENSSNVNRESKTAIQDLVFQPMSAPHSSIASAACVEASNISFMQSQQPVTPSENIPLQSPSVQPVVPTVSTVPSQADVPVKLQFGLFSGPSLIPSPVPAIQIGSIQMPLHLQPQVGPSFTQIHPSQPPFFQFGQLRYTSPISQGILPLAHQSMSFIQPTVVADYSLNKKSGGHLHDQAGLDKSPDNNVFTSQCLTESSPLAENKDSFSQVEDQAHHDAIVKKSYRYIANNGESHRKLQAETSSSQFISGEKVLSGSKSQGPMSSGKGKKYIYTVRNTGSRSSFNAPETPHIDSSGFHRRARRNIQRTEFRVRENGGRREAEGLISSNYGLNEKPYFSGRTTGAPIKSGAKKDVGSKQAFESESSINSRATNSESKMAKKVGKDASTKRLTSLVSGERNLKRISGSEEDVDAPIQSGVVRVFKQPGIEAPSDDDDFIEVRSKRQMLNDRREQREKEIKAKSRIIKSQAHRKARSIPQSTMVSNGSDKSAKPLDGEAANDGRYESLVTGGQGLGKIEVSAGFTTPLVSQPLPPIGTPAVNTNSVASHTVKSFQSGSIHVISDGANIRPTLSIENKNMDMDNIQTSLDSWGESGMDQQVMSLTQTQLDEAMKPERFDTHVASIGDHTPSRPSSSMLTQDKSFSSTSSPLNSLLAGEKIQFGAVTSPSVFLPPISRAISNGIGLPVSCRSDDPMEHNVPASQKDCSLFFKKEKHSDDSCVHLEDPEAEAEAEAEAAASAVAVAAISCDEIVGNGLSAPSVSDAKSFGGADSDGLPTGDGVTCNQQLVNQTRGEESLTVALPADLSVETPLSLWPPLPSPQNSSSQMFPHFSGAPSSHFSCYELNPMLGGPIFAFGPHDESSGNQSQSQKSIAAPWQQCHSGVDSFYSPPAGFTGPFIGPGGISGVQGPPHMVVYNHFAPVGQFGQVGLSFMGTTYIPSGKQPDWKHSSTSSSMGIGEGDINNLNMVPSQHLPPGSPMLPIASPLTMFDMSPFQSSPDIPVQARWNHVPASPLHSVSLSMPLQQQVEGILPSHFSHGLSVDQSFRDNTFNEPRSSQVADNDRNFHVATEATVTQFPDELGLVDPPSSSSNRVPTSGPTYSTLNGNDSGQPIFTKSSRKTIANTGESSGVHNNSSQSTGSVFKAPVKQYYTDQRGEWPHRRGGFQVKNHSLGSDKNFNSLKVKQVYVAKTPTTGASNAM